MPSFHKPLVTVLEGAELVLPEKLNTPRVRNRLVVAGATRLGDAIRERRGRLYAATLVGVVSSRDLQVEILPKTDKSGDLVKSATLLRNMLAFEPRLRGDVRSSRVAPTRGAVLDLVAAAVATRVLHELEDGIPRRYFPATDEMQTIKGRIDLGYQAKRGAAGEVKVLIHHAPLQPDNHLSRLIKAVLLRFHLESRSVTTRRLISLGLQALTPVKSVALTQELVGRAQTTVFEARWSWLVELATLMLGGLKPDPLQAGGSAGFSFLFSLHHLFEQAGRVRLGEALPDDWTLRPSKSIGHLLERQDGALKLLRLQPDYLLEKGSELMLVGDAKWKDVTSGALPRSDLFQITSYLARSGSKVGFLLYPCSSDQPWKLRSFRFQGTSKLLYQLEVDPHLLCSRDPVDTLATTTCLKISIGHMGDLVERHEETLRVV